jgi:ubiquinone/menaquinone biosynthesis C-methylase UbiE
LAAMATFIQKNKLVKSVFHILHELRAKNAILNKIDPFLQKGDKILDIGSGTCHVCKRLLETGFDVSALDVRDVSFFDDIRPVVYDGQIIPFDDDTFDVALILTVLHHTHDPELIIAEAKRVSKKIIIIEDVYSNMFNKYLTFFFDSVGNFELFHHPHSNKTDEQWRSIFDSLQLKLVASAQSFSMPVFQHATYVLQK